MATLKDVKLKITGVKKTKQITKAMNMVATSRLRGAQQNMERFRPYASKFAEVLGSLAERSGEGGNPLLVPREAVRKVHVVLCTSDRGLCGGFNLNLITKAQTFMDERGSDIAYSFSTFGKKGRDWCRKGGMEIVDRYVGVIGGRIPFNTAVNAGRKLVEGFLSGAYDEVYLIYAEFVSMARQEPILQRLLPIPKIETAAMADTEADKPWQAEHICEPSAPELLADLLPRSVYVQLYKGLLETSTSEHAARMAAMDNATKACKDMIDNLTLVYNKARQAAITAELMDIVGGAEALKG